MNSFQGPKFGIVAICVEVVFIFIYGFFMRYKTTIDATQFNSSQSQIHETTYFYFQDVQGMMFLGFGFLMVFLKKYGYSSIAINFLLSVITIQWGLIMNATKSATGDGKLYIDVSDLMNAEFTVAAVLISMGAVLGKLSPLQYLLMSLMEVPIICWNEYLGRTTWGAIDMGDSIFVHEFGAYFGLACSWVISRNQAREHADEGARYDSDLFSMLGTLVLWIYWPSFNAGGATYDGQQRAIINTVISLTGSTFMTFVIASFVTRTVDEDGKVYGKFNMMYIQNAALAGGVGAGACCNLMIQPWGALLIGMTVGTVSTIGFHYITPALTRIYLHDTCGVHNLHGMPGIISGIGSAIAASVATSATYGNNLVTIFPLSVSRTPSQLAGYQLLAICTTFFIAFAGGAVVGVFLRFVPGLDAPERKDLYRDNRFFVVSITEENQKDKYELKESNKPKSTSSATDIENF